MAVSRHVRAAPVTPQMTPNRASAKHASGSHSPDVIDARSDIFLRMSRALNPEVPRGTRNPRIPCSVLAQTTAISAIDPLVIHIFVPDKIQSEPDRRADVTMEPGSDP